MADCNQIRNEGIKKIKAAYDPLIAYNGEIIADMRAQGLDPTKYYDAKNKQVINLVQFVQDLTKERNDDLQAIKDEVDAKCLSDNEEFLQYIVDTAVIFYTDGLSVVLPKHMTHINVKEILAGKPLGGDNSVFNQIRDSIFSSVGLGENNDLRRAVEDPVNTVRRVLRSLGIRL